MWLFDYAFLDAFSDYNPKNSSRPFVDQLYVALVLLLGKNRNKMIAFA